MSRSISDLVRSNPFASPFAQAQCEGGLKVNETRTVAALAADTGKGTFWRFSSV